MSQESMILEIKNSGKPVVICGAGIVGEILLSLCEREGINVECFCDNSAKVASSDFCGKEVILTQDIKKKYDDPVFIVSVAAIKDAVERLNELGYSHWYSGGLLLKSMDVSQGRQDALLDYSRHAIENCILCHEGFLNPGKLFLRSIDLIITERCSLRCKDCSNLMQYYEHPKDCDLEVVFRSIDAICAVVDEIMDFRVIGGDAFMNKQWPMIVKRLTDEPKAKRVVVYTNGTLVPGEKDIPSLQNSKILVIITNYGVLSRKLGELTSALQEHGILHHVLQVDEWLDCAAIVPHRRSADQNKDLYKKCCAKNMATLSDGKLFRCPYAANAARLQAVPDHQEDYIDLFREPFDAGSIQKTKNKVINYFSHTDYLKTCDYCNGRPLSGVGVQPAMQAIKPLGYHKYHSK